MAAGFDSLRNSPPKPYNTGAMAGASPRAGRTRGAALGPTCLPLGPDSPSSAASLMAPDENFKSLDAKLLWELKRLVRNHAIAIDPEEASFDVVRTGIRDNREGLSGPETFRYWEVAEGASRVHSELTRPSGSGDSAGLADYIRSDALKVIRTVSALADEPAPVRLPSESFIRLPMYVLALIIAPIGLALLVYLPASTTSVVAGVVIANIGFLVGAWSWRVRFAKWPGPRSAWIFVEMYVLGLTITEVLAVLGWVHVS